MSDRHTCTKDDPWTPDKGRAEHPLAIHTHDEDRGAYGYYAYYSCPICGKKFSVELAQ